jgi:PEGA domain
LRATREVNGGGHTGAMTAGIVATGLILWPAAPFFLFMHGKDISIPKDTEIPTFVNGNFQLDLSKFQQPAAGSTQSQAAPAPSTSSAELTVTSIPSGADVELDGAFVGNTPSTISTTAGEHTIGVSKNGYKTWERKISVTNGKIDISAELDAASAPDASQAPR